MKTISHLIMRLCISFCFLLVYSCSSEAPVDGILPEGYSWAYGAWHIIPDQEMIESGNHVSDILIGSNYVQDPDAFVLYDEFYPIYTLPKLKYQVIKEENNEDCISILWDGCSDYESRLFLDKRKKTISVWPLDDEHAGKYKNKKYKVHMDRQILNEYDSLYRSYPLWGEWKSIRRGYMNWTLNPSDSLDAYVITKNHHYLISRQQGDYFTYESSDRMKWHRVLYDDEDPRDSVILYKRYDAKKENEERIASIVAGQYFSRSLRVTDDVEVRQTIYFYKDGSGTCVTRNVNIWTNTLDSSVSEQRFNWYLNNDIVECSFSSGEKSRFKVKETLFSTSIVSQENQSEFRMGSLN